MYSILIAGISKIDNDSILEQMKATIVGNAK